MNGDGILKLCAALLVAVAFLTLAVQEKRSHFYLKIELEYGQRTGNN